MRLKELKETLQTIKNLKEMKKENKKLKEKVVEKIKKMIFKEKENINFEEISFCINKHNILFNVKLKLFINVFGEIFEVFINVDDMLVRIEIISLSSNFNTEILSTDDEIIKYFKTLCLKIHKKYGINQLKINKQVINEIKKEYEKMKSENEILKKLCDMQ